MGAPDRPVLGTPPARMARRPSAGHRGAVGPRIRADAGDSGGLAPTSDGRMAVMGADRARLGAYRRHPGPADDPGYLVHGPDTTPSGPADDGDRDGAKVDGGRRDGMRGARDARDARDARTVGRTHA